MPGLKLKLDNNWLAKMWVWIVLKAKYVYLDFKVFKYEHGEEHDNQPILFLDANSRGSRESSVLGFKLDNR